jgi:hypothetical protein
MTVERVSHTNAVIEAPPLGIIPLSEEKMACGWGDILVRQGRIWEEDARVWNQAGEILTAKMQEMPGHILIPKLNQCHTDAWQNAFNATHYSPIVYTSFDGQRHLRSLTPRETLTFYEQQLGLLLHDIKTKKRFRPPPLFATDEIPTIATAFGVIIKMEKLLPQMRHDTVVDVFADPPFVARAGNPKPLPDIPPWYFVNCFTQKLREFGVSEQRIATFGPQMWLLPEGHSPAFTTLR